MRFSTRHEIDVLYNWIGVLLSNWFLLAVRNHPAGHRILHVYRCTSDTAVPIVDINHRTTQNASLGPGATTFLLCRVGTDYGRIGGDYRISARMLGHLHEHLLRVDVRKFGYAKIKMFIRFLPFTIFQYFLIIMTLLITEFGVCLMITAWPQCLGLNLDETAMVKALQGSYGVPGHEQFTAAMDLAQTIFECCAINTAINYDTALWKLQSLGKKELTVPLTCCKLQNRYEYGAYLDPIPRNLTLCQALQPHDYEGNRHLDVSCTLNW